MSQYKHIDDLIIRRIEETFEPVAFVSVCVCVRDEADRLAALTGCESFRVVDRRLQALRKKGVIRYAKKGWVTA